MRKRYFETADTDPPPLEVRAGRRVRFEEVDILRMVWHGRYVSYFEEGRRAFGDRYGFDYAFYMDKGIAAPVVKLHIDYMRPLRLDERFTVVTRLHWSEAVRLNLEFVIHGEEGAEAASGYSVQLLTDMAGRTIILPPPWLEKFRTMWRDGLLKGDDCRAWQP
jgi:acyl-CoA thioester hydrolase